MAFAVFVSQAMDGIVAICGTWNTPWGRRKDRKTSIWRNV